MNDENESIVPGGGLHPSDKALVDTATVSSGVISNVKPQQLMRSAANFGRTHFAEEIGGGSDNVTALVGQSAVLLCRVRNLGNRTVGTFHFFLNQTKFFEIISPPKKLKKIFALEIEISK